MENCIYRIINKTNNKVYIGSTIDSERRELEHLSQLSKGVHINKYLQRSYDKYGKESFIFDIIESELDDGELIKKEQFYIDLFNSSDSDFGYNISPYANKPDGRKYIKVFAVSQREMLKENKLSVNSMALLFFMQCYIEQYTNKVVKPDGVSFNNKELEKGIGVSKDPLQNALRELEEKRFIKRVGGRLRQIYFNPNIASRGGEVKQEVYDMFKG